MEEGVPPSTKAERFDEFPGQEVGIEFPLKKNIDADLLAESIYTLVKTHPGIYKIDESLPSVVEVATTHRRYSRVVDGRVGEKLFVINIRERDGVVSLKKKGAKEEDDGIEYREEAEDILPIPEWNADEEAKVLEAQAKVYDIAPEEITVSEVTLKRKRKIRIIQQDTGRVYTIGVMTKTRRDGSIDQSLSINYVGQLPASPRDAEPVHTTPETDIRVLEDMVGPLVQVAKERIAEQA